MPLNGGGRHTRLHFLATVVAKFSTKQCEASFDFHNTNQSRSGTRVSRAFQIINPQRRSIECREMVEGDLQAYMFRYFLLQNFQRSSARRVLIFTTQTTAGPERLFCELPESPTPSAVAPNAAVWRGRTYKHSIFVNFRCKHFNKAV